MKITKTNAWLLSALVGIALAVGCQQGTERPTTYPVTGTVTQAGAPVAGAVVSFSPTGGGQAATGKTDDAGKYALSTFASADGALPGEYGVKITKFEGQEEEQGSSEEASMDEDMYGAGGSADAAGGADAGAPKNLLPAKYADPSTSGLTASVTEGTNAPIDFDLE